MAGDPQSGRPGHPFWGRTEQIHGRVSPEERQLIERLMETTGLTLTALIIEGFLLLAGSLGIQLRPTDDRTPRTGELATALLEERPLRLQLDTGDPAASAAELATREEAPELAPDAKEAPTSFPPTPSQAEAAAELWARLAGPLQARVGEENYQQWLAGLIPLRAKRNRLALEVESAFLKSELEERFLPVILEEARALVGHHLWISFEIKRSVEEPETKPAASEEAEKPKPLTPTQELTRRLDQARRAAGGSLTYAAQQVIVEEWKREQEERRTRLALLEERHTARQPHAKPKGRSGEG